MKSIVIGAILGLVGCATSREIASGPNGRPIHFIRCGSAVLEACYAKAAEVCPKGYNLIDQQQAANGILTAPTSNSAIFVKGPTSMAVECK